MLLFDNTEKNGITCISLHTVTDGKKWQGMNRMKSVQTDESVGVKLLTLEFIHATKP